MSINSLEVYAELSKKQYNQLIDGEAELEVPYGVSMTNRAGSRALIFECEDSDAAKDLMMGLDNSSINWQVNHVIVDEEENEEDDKFIKKINEF